MTKEVKKEGNKKILSISIPLELYQSLLEKKGKGHVGSFIQQAIEQELEKEENFLRKAYQDLEGNKEYQSYNEEIYNLWSSLEQKEKIKIEPKSNKKIQSKND